MTEQEHDTPMGMGGEAETTRQPGPERISGAKLIEKRPDLTKEKLREWLEKGLTCLYVGKTRMFDEAEVDQWVQDYFGEEVKPAAAEKPAPSKSKRLRLGKNVDQLCPVCTNRYDEPRFCIVEKTDESGIFSRLKCPECSFWLKLSRPESDEIMRQHRRKQLDNVGVAAR
jgi:hypothetical protein